MTPEWKWQDFLDWSYLNKKKKHTEATTASAQGVSIKIQQPAGRTGRRSICGFITFIRSVTVGAVSTLWRNRWCVQGLTDSINVHGWYFLRFALSAFQTAEWLSGAPFAMEECGQLVLEPHQLKTLLHHHHRQNNMKQCESSARVHEALRHNTRSTCFVSNKKNQLLRGRQRNILLLKKWINKSHNYRVREQPLLLRLCFARRNCFLCM